MHFCDLTIFHNRNQSITAIVIAMGMIVIVIICVLCHTVVLFGSSRLFHFLLFFSPHRFLLSCCAFTRIRSCCSSARTSLCLLSPCCRLLLLIALLTLFLHYLSNLVSKLRLTQRSNPFNPFFFSNLSQFCQSFRRQIHTLLPFYLSFYPVFLNQNSVNRKPEY